MDFINRTELKFQRRFLIGHCTMATVFALSFFLKEFLYFPSFGERNEAYVNSSQRPTLLRFERDSNLYIHQHGSPELHFFLLIYLFIYLFIYLERERERERDRQTDTHTHTHTHTHTQRHTHTHRVCYSVAILNIEILKYSL